MSRPRGRLPNGEALFSIAQAREIRARYRTGETAEGLARVYETSNRTIRFILRGQHGYPLLPGEPAVVVRSAVEELARVATRNREAVIALHAAGRTAAEAADAARLALGTVQKIGRDLGLTWPRPPAPEEPVAHGTLAGYRRCGPPKCEPCKAANTEKMRDYVARIRAKAS